MSDISGGAARPASPSAIGGGGYSTSVVAPIAAWYRATWGDEALVAACTAGNLDPGCLAETADPLRWEQIEAFLAAARARLPSDDAFMELCAFSPPVTRNPLRFLRHVAGPGVLYRLAPALTWPLGTAGRFACVEHGRGFARVRYASPHRESRLLCLWRQSRAIQAPTWWDLPPAALSEGTCIARGDGACEYAISWYGRPRWVLAGMGALAALAAVGALHRPSSPLAWALVPLGAALGGGMERWRNQGANRERALHFARAFRSAVAGALPRVADMVPGERTPATPDIPCPPVGEGPDQEPSRSFRREGDVWRISFAGTTILLRDSRGLALLAHLLRNADQEIHVAALDALTRSGVGATSDQATAAAGADETVLGLGDAGELLDGQAKSEYRRRLAELREELEDAESCHDPGRAAIARQEMEAIGDELRSAITPRGRERRAASNVERARVAVTRRIRAAIVQIGKHHSVLADHLSRSVRTGSFCSYVSQDGAMTWQT